MLGGIFLADVNTIPLTGAGTTYWVSDPSDTSAAPRTDVQLLWADIANTDKLLSTLTINRGTWDGSAFTPAASNTRIGFIATHEGCTLTVPIIHTIKKRTSSNPYSAPAIQVIAVGTNCIGHLKIQGTLVTAA